MASKDFTSDRQGLEKGLIDLFAVITGNGTGQPLFKQFVPNITNGVPSTYVTAGTNGFRGIAAINRTGVGALTVQFGGGGSFQPYDNYVRLLGVEIVGYENATGIPTATAVGIVNASAVPLIAVNGSTGVPIMFSAAGSAIDLAVGDSVTLHFWLQNSLAS